MAADCLRSPHESTTLTRASQTPNQSTMFLSGGGEMGERMRSFDWSSTPLGPPESWPQSLKTAVRIMLMSRQPIWIGWGEQLTYLYNDPYKSIIGGKHPAALGQPVSAVWHEIWGTIGPMLAGAMSGSEGTYVESQLLIMERNGYPEETYYTYSYTPIPGDLGGNGGIICANTDDTQRVISERQLALLRDLATATTDLRSWRDVCRLTAAALEKDPRDLPFALLYALEQPHARSLTLMAHAGIQPGHAAAPEHLPVDGAAWPVADVLANHAPRIVDDLSNFGDLPTGAWHRPPSRAIALPISSAGTGAATGRAGVLIVGLNPFRLVDGAYSDFLALVAGQISAALAVAEAYEQEKQRAESLAEIDRAKTAFFSNVSHEFRTPLTLMLGPTEEVLSAEQDPARRSQLEVVHRNTRRLQKLVNTLLDFSRIEAGRVQAVFAPVDLSHLTCELASVFRSAVERAGMRLVLNCPSLTGEPVYVDRDMYEKVILNLLSNAFKYTLKGEIEVRVNDRGENVEVAVRDTGSGIEPHELPRVFERFHRIDGAQARTHEGSGIGLALVQELVRLHHGSVRAESTPGVGSTFFVTLPKGRSHVPAERLSKAGGLGAVDAEAYVEEALRWLPDDARGSLGPSDDAGQTPDEETAGESRGRIVLADDNADMRDYVRRLLAQRYRVEAVGDGRAALSAARRERPDLIVTDVMMPVLDGFGLLEDIRRDPVLQSVPVLMLSARAGEEARLEGLRAGADDYLVKPFSGRELVGRVGSLLHITQMRRESEMRERALRGEAEALNEVAMALAADLDLEKIVQKVTDAATSLTHAAFGAFFYNVINEKGESYTLYSLSGVPRSAFEKFPMPRNTGVFAPTFKGEGIVRSDDITQDPRYGRNAPHHGMPKGHLPVRSYLAAPVISRSGEVLGGLFFGHPEPGVFTERAERLAAGVAAQAAVAIDNARLYGQAQRERHALSQSEDRLRQTLESERAARAEAERAGRMKDEFLATLSHELRTPLNAILGWTHLLRRQSASAGNIEQGLAVIDRNARIQTQLIADLLDMSRIISGKMRLDVQRVELPVVIEAALESVRPAAEAKDVRIQSVLEPVKEPIHGDPARLQQIVWNLLSNAVKFTARGGRVQVVLARVNSHMEITVSDTGKGIKPEFLPHVFDRFRQADSSAAREHGGLGLGLAIVKQLVELHGGSVHAASDGDGKGATFSIHLPLAVLHQESHSTEKVHPRAAPFNPVASDEPDLAGVRVLVVDDEPDARDIVRRVLEEAGAAVWTAGSARDGVEQAAAHTPDVIVSDIGMPGEDGYSFIRSLRNAGNKTPAAALTAFARSEDRTRALLAGYQTHLSKPVEPSELLATVASLTHKSGVIKTPRSRA